MLDLEHARALGTCAVLMGLGATLHCKGADKNDKFEPQVKNPQAVKTDRRLGESESARKRAQCNLAKIPLRTESKGKVVALGDLHGDLAQGVRALEIAGVMDKKFRWSGGDTVLVQTGDVLDRGDDEPELLALLKNLQGQAEIAGGQVILLNGNHEFMNAMGDFRYVTDDGLRDYSAAGSGAAGVNSELSAQGRARAFAPGGVVSMEFASRNIAAIVDDTVFVHGGILPEYADTLDALNYEARCFLSGQGEPPRGVVEPTGPLWARDFSNDAPDCSRLKESLESLGVKRMVVGHTPQMHGITAACDEQVFRIDVGMAAYYGGQPQALVIVQASSESGDAGARVSVLKSPPRKFK